MHPRSRRAAACGIQSTRRRSKLERHEQDEFPLAHDGVRIVRAGDLDSNTPQTRGMQRRAAVTTASTGAKQLGPVRSRSTQMQKRAAHHHGGLESVIYVVSGVAALTVGRPARILAGDFIYVPPYVPHQEINASDDLQLHCVLARSGQQGLVVNLDIIPVEVPELVRWIDDLHK